jgi:hypothetical protein
VTGAESRTVPLSHALGRRTVGHHANFRDNERDNGGTVDLKALAREVLRRGSARDTSGTPPKSTVPTVPGSWDTCPAEWRAGFALLDARRPPTNFSSAEWRRIVRDADLFLSIWGKQAADLGWTSLDLFGAHPKAPAARYSCMGLLLLLRGGRVVALTASTAIIEQQSSARLTYTRRPPGAECVPLWELSHASQDHPTAATTRAP